MTSGRETDKTYSQKKDKGEVTNKGNKAREKDASYKVNKCTNDIYSTKMYNISRAH